MHLSFAFVLAAVHAASAASVPRSKLSTRWPYDPALGPPNADCYRETYPITVSPENNVFTNVTVPANTDNATFITALTQRYATDLPSLANFTAEFLSNGTKKAVPSTYNISGILCTPLSGAKDKSTVQLLIHGIGFDSSYWHFQGSGVPLNNSYVAHAADAGYTTFRFDRLGTGQSQHPADGYNVVQAPTDVAIATKVAQSLKAGSLSGIPAFKKLISVGHSYGSVQTNALTAVPGLVDHAILTGFSANSSSVPLFLSAAAYTPAYEVFPSRLGNLDYEYLVTATPQTSQTDFLYYPNFTPAMANLSRTTEQPVTPGVLFTFGAVAAPVPAYKGTVAVVTADKDVPFCGGNCYAVPPNSTNMTSILDGVRELYPATSKFTTYIPALTGHAISVHNTAGSTYAWIQKYIASL